MSRLIHSSLITPQRPISFEKKLGVYYNGVGNSYPEEVERAINNSATAKPAIKIFMKYLVGNSFGDLDSFIVNDEYQITLAKFLSSISRSYAYQNGVFIHVNYNLNCKITGLRVLPYKHCLIGKKDDKNYNGKILVYDNWNGEYGKIDKNKIEVIDVFNPNKEVVQSQIRKAKNLDNYKGQLMFFNPSDTIYPLAHIDNVIKDADSEYLISEYKNTSLKKGFFGKMIVVTPPMVDGNIARKPINDLTELELNEKRDGETARDNFRESVESFAGGNNVGNPILVLEMEHEGDDIDSVLKFIKVDTNVDDKLFEHTESSVNRNITRSLGVPNILINNNDNTVFSNSGALLKNAKIHYQEQTAEDRRMLENEILEPLLSRFKGFVGTPKIKLLTDPKDINDDKVN